MIVAGPGPIDDIAGPDGHGARIEDGPALPHGDICRRRRSEHGQEKQKRERQFEFHFGGWAQLGRILAWYTGAAIEWDESASILGRCVID